MEFPESFRQNILDNFKEQGAAWLQQLPVLIRHFEERWSLKLGEPFLLSYSYCAPGVQAGEREVVLKLAVPCEETSHHILAVLAYNGRGMVRALEADLEQGALLMERLRPGRMLVEEVQDDEEAARIAAGVMRRLWAPVPDGAPFLSMADWAEEFGQIRVKFRESPCPLSAKTIDRTETLFQELLASQGPVQLLHGDLHHFNILSAWEEGRLGWRAVDPFGVVGEREVEVGAFMKNPDLALPFNPQIERRLARRLAVFHEALGLDLQRLTAWSSVYAALSAWWTISVDADGWQVDAALADFLAGLLD